jgi:oligopeptide/dipeptide ABC transporter ATP-binding protein
MYGGQLVEIANVKDMFAQPAHPYSDLLIQSVPTLTERKPMQIHEGITHNPRNPPSGCIFRLRCPYAMPKCAQSRPPLIEIRPQQSVACHLWQKTEDDTYVRQSV